jgi:hypothetical protein
MLRYRVDDNRDMIESSPAAAIVPSTLIDVTRSKFNKVINIHILFGWHKDAHTKLFQAPTEVTRRKLRRYLSILAATQQMLRPFYDHNNEDYKNILRFWLRREEQEKQEDCAMKSRHRRKGERNEF